MRSGRIVVGVIILIISVAVYFSTAGKLEEMARYGITEEFMYTMDEDIQSEYETYKNIQYASFIGMGIGFLFVISGIAVRSPKEEKDEKDSKKI